MRTVLVSATLLLAACAGAPVPPDWQVQASTALEQFRRHYLEGNSRQAQRSFAQAKTAVAATGRPELVAHVELVRCALGIAAIDVEACAQFDAMRDESSADDQAYRAFLDGRWQAGEAPRLPAQYRSLVTAGDEAARNAAMQRIEDPVSRLVAAGTLFRLAQLSPQGLGIAVETASAQGYRRPLLAYLSVEEKRAEAVGDSVARESIRKRIDLVYRSLPEFPEPQPKAQ